MKMTDVSVEEAKKIRESIKLLQALETKHKAKLLIPRSVDSLLEALKPIEKRNELQQYIEASVNREIQPVRDQLDAILSVLQQKPIKSGTIKFAPATKEKDIEKEVDKKLEQVSGKQWDKVDESAEVVVMKYGEHLLTIYADSQGNRMANIDNGRNIAIKSESDIAAMKKQVEGMA